MPTNDVSADPIYLDVHLNPAPILKEHLGFIDISVQVVNMGSAQTVYIGTANVQSIPLQLNDIYRKRTHGNCHYFDAHDVWVRCDQDSPTPPQIVIYGELYTEGG